MIIFEAIRDLDNNEFIKYLHEEIEIKGKQKDMMSLDDIGEYTLLDLAIMYGKSADVMFKLIELGGEEFVRMKNIYGRTSLLTACSWNVATEVIFKLIELGGQELVIGNTSDGTALHDLCRGEKRFDVILKMIEIGRRELVIRKTDRGMTAFMIVCRYKNPPIEIVSKFIEAGGQELLLLQDKRGRSVLHHAIQSRYYPIKTILKLIETGGRELVMLKNENHHTVLHFACSLYAPKEIILKMIETGGRELVVVEDKNGFGAIHSYFRIGRDFDEIFTVLIREGILGNFGGWEFGLGGLFFDYDDELQRRVYDQWDDLVYFLELALLLLTKEQRPLLLHSAFMADAPSFIISSIIKRFGTYGCVLKRSFDDYLPIDVAVINDHEWKKGLQDITEATARALQQPLLYTAGQYGVKWDNGMKEIAESNVEEVIHGYDNSTGLCPFMVAAIGSPIGERSDLSSIYMLLKMSPERIQYPCIKEPKNMSGRKRKEREY